MTTIFFLLTIIFVLHEAYTMPLLNPEFYDKIRDNLKSKDKEKKSEFTKEHWGFLLTGLLYLMWLLIGVIMSSQWILFAVILGMSFVGSAVRKLLPDWLMKRYKDIDVLITIAILLYIAWNHFHN
jgi:cation transport ATPase